jgi:hypothetical protein
MTLAEPRYGGRKPTWGVTMIRGKLFGHFRQNVVAYLALFVALGGTGAYAANTIYSSDIVDGEVKSADIEDALLGTPAKGVQLTDLAENSVNSVKLKDGAVKNHDLADAAVTTGKFASSAKAPDADKLAGKSSSAYWQVGGVTLPGFNNIGGPMESNTCNYFRPEVSGANVGDVPIIYSDTLPVGVFLNVFTIKTAGEVPIRICNTRDEAVDLETEGNVSFVIVTLRH